MHRLFKLFPMPLIIHDAGAAAPGAAPAAPQAGTAQPANGQQAKPGEAKPVVVYGKQPTQPAQTPPAAGEKPTVQQPTDKTDNAPADRKAKFKELINGEYKDEFTEAFQESFDRRFKDHKTVKEQLDAANPLLKLLGAKYGVDNGDPKKLMEAVEKDNEFFDKLAEKAGMTTEQYRDALKLRLDHEKVISERDTATAELQRIQRNNELRQQETAMKAKYPDFDLAKLLIGDAPSNRNFADLLNKGVDVEPAFQAAFFHELMSGVMTSTGKRAEQNVIDNIQAKAQRPREAGVASTPGITTRDDVSKLSKADRAEIMRRAARGEKISF